METIPIMSENHKKFKKSKLLEAKRRRISSTSGSRSSESDEWVEKDTMQQNKSKGSDQREDWMSMTGMLKTFTKDDLKPKREEKDKKHIDSYNPATCSRELNPYWKNGGTGLPQTSDSFRKSNPFCKPSDDDDYYYSKSRHSNSHSRSQPKDDDDGYYSKFRHSKSYSRSESKDNNRHSHSSSSKGFVKPAADDNDNYFKTLMSSSTGSHDKYKNYKNYDNKAYRTSSNWKRQNEKCDTKNSDTKEEYAAPTTSKPEVQKESNDIKNLSDEKMNKLAAKIVKAEILGNTKLIEKLKNKLEEARHYRKQNPDAGNQEEDDRIMLISTSSFGNSRPLASGDKGDPRSRARKRKAETHFSGERVKYFGNDDKYNLKEMFEQEKYGNYYNNEAELAKVTSKHKNPNDDLEDIFMDEISKNRNEVKDSETEKQRAIHQHMKLEKSLEGCEYCVDSKNMLKHLMVSMGNKVYLSVPSKKSLVKDQCVITTIQHSTCVTSVDEDVWEEILNYKRALTHFFNSQNKDVVFFETATRLHKYPHLVINCVPLPRDVGDMAAIYFKKALLECEAEWSMNKKVVNLKGKNIRKGVPKGLPYFWIDFGMDPGFAHVIEDQQLFPKNFAEELIGGMLDLEHNLWKNPRKECGDIQRKKVLDFIKEWKHYEPKKI